MSTAIEHEGHVQVPGGTIWFKIVGSSGGIPLLTLHGGPSGGHDYLEPLQAVASERPVVFYDQLGCGKSDKPSNPSLWRIERFVEEIAPSFDLTVFTSWGTHGAVGLPSST